MKIEQMLKTIEDESAHFYEAQLRKLLDSEDRQWLVEQLVTYIIKEKYGEVHHEISVSKKKYPHETLAKRKERISRIQALNIDLNAVKEIRTEFDSYTRESLEKNGHINNAEHKGLKIVPSNLRSEEGNQLLVRAKDFLFALLFCGKKHGVNIERTKRDELTITIASDKANCLESFMIAVTEFPARGVWYDSEGISDDENATNTVMQVEFGDDEQGVCASALMSALKLINNLEINEEILYCRIEQAKYSSLI